MKNLSTIPLLFLLVLSLNVWGQSTFFSYGSDWKYYDEGNKPAAQSNQAWYKNAYDHSLWSSGEAELGYGDNDEETELNSDAKTLYFRKEFSVSDANDYSSLQVDLRYDDGAVLYLNGTEVKRVNMPSGTIDYNTYTTDADGDNSVLSFEISNLLFNGSNVIAVEMHQRSSSSSDLSFDLKLAGNEGVNPNGGNNVSTNSERITRGPYLQKTNSESIVIKWSTDVENASIVKYGTSPTNLFQTAYNGAEVIDHELKLTGLSPNTTYYYSFPYGYSSNVDLEENLYFKTHPEEGATEPFRAWVLGDCGTKDYRQRKVRDGFRDFNDDEELDMILLLGDNAYGGGRQIDYQYSLFENMYEEELKNTAVWSTFGNHDSDDANSYTQSGTYYDIFSFPKQGESGGIASGTEAYYSFDYGNIHFIVLDSEGTNRDEDGAMYEWCENDIQNTLADWIIALWHHPPYSDGSHSSDNENGLSKMREVFVPMLEENGIDLVLSGHSHSYERSYLINGHYGKSYTFNEDDHTIGSNGFGDGQKNGDGAYQKEITGSKAGDGAVYVVAGSSGKRSGANLNHPAMYVGMAVYGSCLLEVDGNELDLTFVNNDGEADDYFTLRKEINPIPSGGGGTTTGNTPDCNDVVISADSDGIFIDGSGGAPKVIIEVKDSNWNTVFTCNGNCPSPTTFIPRPSGTYYVAVKYFTEIYGWICQATEFVQVSGGASNNTCNINVEVDGDDIEIDGFDAAHRIMKAFDSDWNYVLDCFDDCNSYTELSNLEDDEYYVRFLGYNDFWEVICEYAEYVTIGSGVNLLGNGQTAQLFLRGNKNNKAAQLNWVTNTDFKNQYFYLERSSNGLDFEVIQEVNSESESEEYYTYFSKDLLPQEGTNFYRVKQIYDDARFRYSNILRLDFPSSVSNNNLYPNPTSDIVNLNLQEYMGERVKVTITNSQGEVVKERELQTVSENQISLSVHDLPAGGYIVSIKKEGAKSSSYHLAIVRE